MKNAPLLIAGIALAALSRAHAATVLIDWSTASIVTDPAGDGKYWNSLGSPTWNDLGTTALVDVNNAASGWSVAVDNTFNSGTGQGAGFGGTGIAGPTGGDPFDETNAVNDGIFVNRNDIGTSTITLTGLGNGNQFNFSAIGGRASNGADGLITILTGTSTSTTYDLLNSGTLLNFSVTSSNTGTISFRFSEKSNDTNGTTNAVFKAMSITPVPEPSAAFLGLGGCLLLLRRRR
jgi:hypothetical protein